MQRTRIQIAMACLAGALVAQAAIAQPAAPVPPAPPAAPANAAAEAPATGGTLPTLPKNATAAATAPVAQTPEKQFSYGNSNLSLLFLPEQVTRMKDTIRAYEIANANAKPTTVAVAAPVVSAAPVAEKLVEPAEYPVFFLSTIVYDKPGDWSIWVSGEKITSRKNETDVKVISVTRDAVSFVWQPAYIAAIKRRNETNGFGATDSVKNKLAATQTIQQDPETGAITFTLRQNQSFAVGYFSVFEGYMENPKLEALSDKLPVMNSAENIYSNASNYPPGMNPGVDNYPTPGMSPNPGMAPTPNPTGGMMPSSPSSATNPGMTMPTPGAMPPTMPPAPTN